jgi:hypothetical protein
MIYFMRGFGRVSKLSVTLLNALDPECRLLRWN